VSGLHHVALELAAQDAEDGVRFWALLGFGRVEPPGTLARRSVWVEHFAPRGARQQVHFLLTDDPVAPPAGHVAVHVEDYEGCCARLREAGFALEPRPQHWGAARAFVRAPGGHRVEIMAAPP